MGDFGEREPTAHTFDVEKPPVPGAGVGESVTGCSGMKTGPFPVGRVEVSYRDKQAVGAPRRCRCGCQADSPFLVLQWEPLLV